MLKSCQKTKKKDMKKMYEKIIKNLYNTQPKYKKEFQLIILICNKKLKMFLK